MMAALVQTYPQETGTITMLQTRPTSATGRMPSSQQQPVSQYSGPSSQSPRTYHGNATFTGYRGSSTPVQQYAFQSTPSLNQSTQWQQQQGSYRANPSDYDPSVNRHRFPNQTHGVGQSGSRDDSAINSRQGGSVARPQPAHTAGSSNQGATTKATPDRYRRPQAQNVSHARSQSATLPSTTNLPNTVQFYNVGNNARAAMANRPTSFYASVPGSSMDDMHIYQQPQQEVKGSRRKSIQHLEAPTGQKMQVEQGAKAPEGVTKNVRVASNNSAHSRTGSSDSVNSSRSAHSRPSVSCIPPATEPFEWVCYGIVLVSLTVIYSLPTVACRSPQATPLQSPVTKHSPLPSRNNQK